MQYEVFKCFIISIFVGSGIVHLTVNGDGAFLHHLLFCWDKQHVVGLQGDVCRCSIENTVHIHGQYLQGAVRLHAVHHCVGSKCFFVDAFGTFQQCAYAINLSAHLIHARTEYGTFQFNHIVIAVEDGINTHGVLVGQVE